MIDVDALEPEAELVLAAVHPRANRHLAAKVGERCRAVFARDSASAPALPAVDANGKLLVQFEDALRSRFWISPRWLAAAPVDRPGPGP